MSSTIPITQAELLDAFNANTIEGSPLKTSWQSFISTIKDGSLEWIVDEKGSKQGLLINGKEITFQNNMDSSKPAYNKIRNLETFIQSLDSESSRIAIERTQTLDKIGHYNSNWDSANQKQSPNLLNKSVELNTSDSMQRYISKDFISTEKANIEIGSELEATAKAKRESNFILNNTDSWGSYPDKNNFLNTFNNKSEYAFDADGKKIGRYIPRGLVEEYFNLPEGSSAADIKARKNFAVKVNELYSDKSFDKDGTGRTTLKRFNNNITGHVAEYSVLKELNDTAPKGITYELNTTENINGKKVLTFKPSSTSDIVVKKNGVIVNNIWIDVKGISYRPDRDFNPTSSVEGHIYRELGINADDWRTMRTELDANSGLSIEKRTQIVDKYIPNKKSNAFILTVEVDDNGGVTKAVSNIKDKLIKGEIITATSNYTGTPRVTFCGVKNLPSNNLKSMHGWIA